MQHFELRVAHAKHGHDLGQLYCSALLVVMVHVVSLVRAGLSGQDDFEVSGFTVFGTPALGPSARRNQPAN